MKIFTFFLTAFTKEYNLVLPICPGYKNLDALSSYARERRGSQTCYVRLNVAKMTTNSTYSI